MENKSTSGFNADLLDFLTEDTNDTLTIESKDPNVFPKLDKLYGQILQVQTQTEKISGLYVVKTQTKVNDPKEKKNKKAEIVTNTKKYTPFEEELLQAFKNEKNKFR